MIFFVDEQYHRMKTWCIQFKIIRVSNWLVWCSGLEYECIVSIVFWTTFGNFIFQSELQLSSFGGGKKHLCYLCNCAGSDVLMKQHPGSYSGAEAIKSAAAAGSMLHSMYPMQHVSVLSIPPTRWIATSLGTGVLSQKHWFSWQRRPPSIFWFCCLIMFLLRPSPEQGHIVM